MAFDKGVPLIDALVHSNLCENRYKSHTAKKLDYMYLDYITVLHSTGLSSTILTKLAPQSTEFGKITQNNGQYIVQGHSRSPISVLFESLYATSY